MSLLRGCSYYKYYLQQLAGVLVLLTTVVVCKRTAQIANCTLFIQSRAAIYGDEISGLFQLQVKEIETFCGPAISRTLRPRCLTFDGRRKDCHESKRRAADVCKQTLVAIHFRTTCYVLYVRCTYGLGS